MHIPKILIIDDESDILDLLKEVLEYEFEDYQIIQAQGGVNGLKLATEELPHLILLDVVMPVMQGQEVLQKIKERNLSTRVIMMSAKKTSLDDAVYFIKLGACDYITKPFTNNELINKVRRALVADSTINLSISNNPAIEQLTANIQQWQSDNKKLKQKYKELIKTNKKLKEESLSKGFVDDIIWLCIRLVCLLISGGIAFALLSLNIISPNIPFIVTTLCLFLLICIPIEKIKNLVFKVPNIETNVEIDDER